MGSTLIANRKIAYITILSFKGGNFISPVTEYNLGKKKGLLTKWLPSELGYRQVKNRNNDGVFVIKNSFSKKN